MNRCLAAHVLHIQDVDLEQSMCIHLRGVGGHRRDDVAFRLYVLVAAVADQIGDGLPGVQIRNQFDAGVTGADCAGSEKKNHYEKFHQSLHVDAQFERRGRRRHFSEFLK